ncbi:MAG: hypothetical protein IPK60_11865 [Sandaracinaceae bacterium]|nr:hypothetical protein [Sandaracinaceae bacterium]
MKSFKNTSLAFAMVGIASMLALAGCGGEDPPPVDLDLGVNPDLGDGAVRPDMGDLGIAVDLGRDAGDLGIDIDLGPIDMGSDGGAVLPPGITVTPTTGLSTSETGSTDTFTVVLDSQPTANVTIAITTSDDTEATAAPTTLTFTPENWNAPQTVTVTGVNDDTEDGNQDYTILTAAAVSTDSNYSGLNGADVAGSNIDDESAGITVEPTSGLTTTEGGDDDTFTIVLNTQPTADVTIALSSSASDEATIVPDSVTFTTANWNSAQTVTVTGVDDASADGNQDFTIVTAAATSSDADYSGLDAEDVAGTNLDDETPGIIVDPISGANTTEAGGTTTITVVLQSEPSGDVMIPVATTDDTEGTIDTPTVVFDMTNWNIPQVITVTGVNDDAIDGDQVFHITFGPAASTDAGYEGLRGLDAVITNTDDETAGVTLTPDTGLTTTEAGGTATFTIVLNSMPTADVTIDLTSTNTDEGTVDPASLTFTSGNWNIPQTVTVTGVNDAAADGPIDYQINAATSSADMNYQALADLRADVTNTDDETAGITVTPTTGLTTTESGGATTFTIVLNSQPTADVTIGLSSDATTEGTVAPSSLTFTASDWNVPQTVTVTGVNDFVADGSKVYHIVIADAVSTDADYSGLVTPNVDVTNTDDDMRGLVVSPTSLSISEGGSAATFTIVLTSEPIQDVTIPLAVMTGDATVNPTSVLFTSANWNIPQTVTVTPVDDAIADGTVMTFVQTLPATGMGLTYPGYDGPDVTLTVNDNDAASIVVTPTSGLSVTEAGSTATFTIVLGSQPTADVSVTLLSGDATEGSVMPSSVSFNETNWNVPQTVTVAGVDDSAVDGSVMYSITTSSASSADSSYSGLAVSDVSVTTTDNDTATVSVTPTSGLVTSEGGSSASFAIVLGAQPSADVTIALSSSNTAEGTVAPASVTFTNGNWNVPQSVSVTGVDDFAADGAIAYTIITGATVSTDPAFSGVAVADVSVSNSDNDVPGVIVSPTSGLMTSEGLTTTTFTIVLATQPSASVTIALSSSNTAEGTVSPASVMFTTATWNMPATVTITGVDDMTADGAVGYTIVTGAASSADAGYNGLTVTDVSVTNLDNDVAPTISSTAPSPGTLIAGVDTFPAYTPTATGTPTFPPGVVSVTGLPSWMTFDGVAPAACAMQTFTAGTLAGCSPIPASAFGSYSITLTANNGIAPNATQVIAFSVIAPPPTLTSITPALARRQATVPVTIRGLSFSTIGAVTSVNIRLGSGGTLIPLSGFSVVDAQTITATVSADLTRTAGTYDVVVVQSGVNYVLARALNVTSGNDGTLVSGNITFDTTWSKAGSPFIVNNNISIINGATLTIQPGTTIIMGASGSTNNSFRFDVGVAGAGNLIADGGNPATSGEPIVFTSYQPLAGMPTGGKWGNIRIGSMASATTVLRNVVVEYGSRDASAYNGALEVQANANISTITDSIIRESDRAGLYIGSGVQTLPNTIINNSTISRNATAMSGTYYPIVVAADSVPTLGSTMTWSLNGRDQISVIGGTIQRGDSSSLNIWKRFTGIDYVVSATTVVQGNITLSIAAGNTVRFPLNQYLYIGNTTPGGLSIDAAGNSVTLTSLLGTAGQEWGGIRFSANASASLLRGVNITAFNNLLAGGIRLYDPTVPDTVTTPVVTIDQCNIASTFLASVGLYADQNARPVSVTNTTFDTLGYSVNMRMDDLHTAMATTNIYKTALFARTGTFDIARNALDATVWPKVVDALGAAQTITFQGTLTISSSSLQILGGNVLALPDNGSFNVTTGKLLLSGTVTSPITIKSTNPGVVFWDRILLTGNTTGGQTSTITYTTFQNGGYDVAAVNEGIAYIYSNCTGTNCATPTIQNNTFTGSNGYGVSFGQSGTNGYGAHANGTFTGNTITGSRFSPVQIYANWVNRLGTGNLYTGNNTTATLGYSGVRVTVGNGVYETQTWPALNASDTLPAYMMSAQLWITNYNSYLAARTNLTLSAGVDIRFAGNTNDYLLVGYTTTGQTQGGDLITSGTATNPVRITNYSDSVAGGYWRGVLYEPDSSTTSTSTYTIFSYGGRTGSGNTGSVNFRFAAGLCGRPVMNNSTFSNAQGFAATSANAVCTAALTSMTYSGNAMGDCVKQLYAPMTCVAGPTYP